MLVRPEEAAVANGMMVWLVEATVLLFGWAARGWYDHWRKVRRDADWWRP